MHMHDLTTEFGAVRAHLRRPLTISSFFLNYSKLLRYNELVNKDALNKRLTRRFSLSRIDSWPV
jgi:hypothetical protein